MSIKQLKLWHYGDDGVHVTGEDLHGNAADFYILLHNLQGPPGRQEVDLEFVGLDRSVIQLPWYHRSVRVTPGLCVEIGDPKNCLHGNLELIYFADESLKIEKLHTAKPPNSRRIAESLDYLFTETHVPSYLINGLAYWQD